MPKCKSLIAAMFVGFALFAGSIIMYFDDILLSRLSQQP